MVDRELGSEQGLGQGSDQGSDQGPALVPVRSDGRWRPGESGNPSGRPARSKLEVEDGLTDGVRMRRVYGQPSEADCNSAQRRLRKLLDKDVKSYLQLMTQMEDRERAGLAVLGVSLEGAVVLPDEGESRVREVIAELLAEAGGVGG